MLVGCWEGRGMPRRRRARLSDPPLAPVRLLLGVVATIAGLVLLSAAGRGVEQRTVTVGPTPVSLYVPEGATVAASPGVVVAHGFAGSRQLMHSWSLALARAGFVVAAPDLAGHGGSALRIAEDREALAADVGRALTALRDVDAVDHRRIGLLGHSMGSGAVLAAGIADPVTFRAVVAVSPTDAPVTTDAPRDLLLLAGANERRFVANAESLLERAGGAGGAPGDGDARALAIVPRVEHVTILFSDAAQARSVAWLAAALAHEPTVARRIEPLLGWLLAAVGVVLLFQHVARRYVTAADDARRTSSAWVMAALGGLAATASLIIIARSVTLSDTTGVLVAGEVGLWFALAGAAWLRFGVRPAAPDARDLGWGVLGAVALVAIGALGARAWLAWWPTGARAALVVPLVLAVAPFVLATMAVLQGSRGLRLVGGWSAVAVMSTVTLGAAAFTVPGLGFLVLVLPLVPLVLGLVVAVGAVMDRPWAGALAGSTFLGWLLAVLFPLAGGVA
jgi:dienelactone hydrolase